MVGRVGVLNAKCSTEWMCMVDASEISAAWNVRRILVELTSAISIAGGASLRSGKRKDTILVRIDVSAILIARIWINSQAQVDGRDACCIQAVVQSAGTRISVVARVWLAAMKTASCEATATHPHFMICTASRWDDFVSLRGVGNPIANRAGHRAGRSINANSTSVRGFRTFRDR